MFLAKITLTLSLQLFENNLKLEVDSQVLQGVQAGEGLLGDGSDLVPLQISSGGKNRHDQLHLLNLLYHIFRVET